MHRPVLSVNAWFIIWLRVCIMSYDICLPWILTDGHWSISFWLITERELTMQRSRWAGILWRGWSSSVPLHQPTVWWWHWPGHLAGCPVPLPSRTGKTTDVHHPIKQANKPIQSKIVHINIQKLTYLCTSYAKELGADSQRLTKFINYG